MSRLGASKLSLSSITSKALWERSGRFQQSASELFQFQDRRAVECMLSPTHEEEISSLVSQALQSYKDLPLRLYQIGRKYRDERRPRQGLLRSREFVMKDLYSFDISYAEAIKTYEQVRQAYSNIFTELGIPHVVTEASSGNMGGSLSHEYHMPSSIGEDLTVKCNSCEYAANMEVARSRLSSQGPPVASTRSAVRDSHAVWRGVTKDRRSLVNVWYSTGSTHREVNIHAVADLIPDLDASIEDASRLQADLVSSKGGAGLRVINLVDHKLDASEIDELASPMGSSQGLPANIQQEYLQLPTTTIINSQTGEPLNLLEIHTGDGCPKCETGSLDVFRTVELGHTFYLGTRYSEPLGVSVTVPLHQLEGSRGTPGTTGMKGSGSLPATVAQETTTVPVQMGCYGIGISRIIGAAADKMSDSGGLIWPPSIAPYQVVVIHDRDLAKEGEKVYDVLASAPDHGEVEALDVVLDDRKHSMPWKIKDADLVGYPVVVILGKAWRDKLYCEVQCRRLSLREYKPLSELPAYVRRLLNVS